MAFVVDNSGALTATGNEVSVLQQATASTKFNALWKEGPGLSPTNPTAQFFHVTVLEGEGVWVGFTDEAHFGAGWKCKAFSYGGNLSDGGGLLRSAFGPRLQRGNVVGLRAELIPDGGGSDTHTLTIHVSIDQRGLGQAFDIRGVSGANIGPLYPVISFSTGPARASLTAAPCPEATYFAVVPESTRATVNGQWRIPSAEIESTSPATFPEVVFTVDLARSIIGAAVANQMSVGIAPTHPHPSHGHVASTMLMPPPALEPLERRVNAIIGSVSGLDLAEDGAALILSHADGRLTLRPHQARHSPVTRDEVRFLSKN